MTRQIPRVALLTVLVVLAVVVPAAAHHGGSRHGLHPVSPPLPRSLTVDEQEWSIVLSQKLVAGGPVHFTVYNRGQDSHDLVIRGLRRAALYLKPGQSAMFVARLRRGTYELYCSMFMGRPESHYMRGMHTVLTVR